MDESKLSEQNLVENQNSYLDSKDFKKKNKNWNIKAEDMKELFHWDFPEGCFATDRILVDGCKVGYMYREEPDADSDMPDSG